ncbi:MAG: class I SAM-dependent methyltransferase [bacterium]|jgi:ubiquinone/menaquinone biosynthesis C-methylase UbiE|nr:class I SAM-dependent methyltransferase [bacterium]
MRASTPGHWQRFWEQADRLELDDVYGTDGRMVREITGIFAGEPGGLRGRRILEVGAGTGRDAVALAAAGATVVTIDYVKGSLGLTQKAAAQARADVTAVCGDGLGMPFPDGAFDVVFHQGLLEHFREPGFLLRENVRVLKPGGYLVVDVPQTFHYYTVGKQVLIALNRWFAGWETQFTIDQLEKLAREQGTTITRSYGDWMVPGLWYRALRKILLTRTGVKLPMRPEPLPALARAGEAWRRWFARRRLSLYTTPTIGVIARKYGGAAGVAGGSGA